jgi:DNA-binding response OmpR family regulator
MKILLVEDDPQVMETMLDYLEMKGHVVDCAYNGKAALTFVEQDHFDVIVLDVMMPKMNGLAAAKDIRTRLHQATPIIFVTARDSLDDKLAGFAAGGDDYLIKPFSLQELEARIKALGQRTKVAPRQATIRIGSLTYDVAEQQGKSQVGSFNLPNIQHQILHQLVNATPNTVKKETLISSVWSDEQPDSDAFRSHLYNLRKTLKEYAPDVAIKTEHARGYRIVATSS